MKNSPIVYRYTQFLLSALFCASFQTSSVAGTLELVTNFPADAREPDSELVRGSDDAFYGTGQKGGAYDMGAIFKITPTGRRTTLYSFTGDLDGKLPKSGLVLGSDGNFYGTTHLGGATNEGTIFKMTPSGALTTLKSMTASTGGNPQFPLVEGTDGFLYGICLLYTSPSPRDS